MTFCSMLTVERCCPIRMAGCARLTWQMLPQQGWWQSPLAPCSPCDNSSLSNDLGDEMFGQVSTCTFCTWFEGTKRLSLGISGDSSHGKAREGPFLKCQALARSSHWPLVSVGLSCGHLSKAGINSKSLNSGWESLPLVWEASAGLRAH